MTEVVSVKFKDAGRSYYFQPERHFSAGDNVIVETANGIAFGTVARENHNVEDSAVVQPLRKVLRKANDRDLSRLEQNHQKEAEAFKICQERILDHKLDMKLVEVEYSFDGTKITFFFTSDGRVDFRELVKDLAACFHTRIELRQIGVRDEARMLGGLGICGQPFCCKQFLDDFQPVSIKMAKEQGLSLNPTKISGSCGRLMCCLKYEQNAYDYLNSITPSVGSTVKTSEGVATVVDANLITGNMTVKGKEQDAIPYKVNRKDVKLIKSKPNKAEKEDIVEEE
ncbi:MAG: stage 0 sporulation family protein [Clostridia bacterium]|nr:stage 0 sporulation family protein [Clostridia bacterium]